jgi:hypothetical protein
MKYTIFWERSSKENEKGSLSTDKFIIVHKEKRRKLFIIFFFININPFHNYGLLNNWDNLAVSTNNLENDIFLLKK